MNSVRNGDSKGKVGVEAVAEVGKMIMVDAVVAGVDVVDAVVAEEEAVAEEDAGPIKSKR
jgi:hypothetical protein